MYRKARVALGALRDPRPRPVVPVTLPAGGNSGPVGQFALRPCRVLLTAGRHDTVRTKQFSTGVPWPYSRALTLIFSRISSMTVAMPFEVSTLQHRLSHIMFDCNYIQMTYCMYDNYPPEGQRTASTGLPRDRRRHCP